MTEQQAPDPGQPIRRRAVPSPVHATRPPQPPPPQQAQAVRLHGAEFRHDPAATYRRIRQQHGPVAPVLLDGDLPAWLVTGYREVFQVTGDPQRFGRDTRRWNAWDRVPDGWPLLPFVGYNTSVMFTEGAEHQRRASAIGDALAAVDQFELRAQCERIADQLIDSFAGRGEADLVADYAQRIPLLVVAALYGMAASETPALVRDIATSLNSGPDSLAAHQRVHAAMVQIVSRARHRPGRDVPSRLLAHPAQLADDDIVLDLIVVTAAAQQPTANWIGNAVRLMLTDARFALTLSGGRGSVSEALNEVLWHDTPTQNFIGRFAVHDTTLGGRRIRSGDLLVLGLAAANADPRVRPDQTVGTDGNHAHLSFGHGEHGCPYPAPEIAEVIARASIEVLLDRLPDVRLAIPADQLGWHPSVWMRGLTALPVTFSPAYARHDPEPG